MVKELSTVEQVKSFTKEDTSKALDIANIQNYFMLVETLTSLSSIHSKSQTTNQAKPYICI